MNIRKSLAKRPDTTWAIFERCPELYNAVQNMVQELSQLTSPKRKGWATMHDDFGQVWGFPTGYCRRDAWGC